MSIFSPIIIFLGIILWGAVHSLTASLGAKARAQRVWGAEADRFYRLGYNLFSLITFLPILALVFLLPDQPLYSVPAPWSFLMLIGQLFAVLTLAAGLLQTDVWHFLGLRQLIDHAHSPPKLVVSGLYRWVRHPLYTAGLLFIWLLPVMTINRLVMNTGLTLYLLIGALFEERKLLREFGEAYQEYRDRTPMLIPWRRTF